jgi:putative phosphoesterase
MKKIMLLSDTHFCCDNWILRGAEQADEVWHAGDIGDLKLFDAIQAQNKTFRGVYGNIDSAEVRSILPETSSFRCEGLKVSMMHIAGFPAKYKQQALSLIQQIKPDIFICGHSHILKVVRDKKLHHLHLNPGAAGLKGFHQVRTFISFTLADGKITDMNIHEKDRAKHED